MYIIITYHAYMNINFYLIYATKYPLIIFIVYVKFF